MTFCSYLINYCLDHYWFKKACTILPQAIMTEAYISAFNSFTNIYGALIMCQTFHLASVLNVADRMSLKELSFWWHLSESIEFEILMVISVVVVGGELSK